RRGAGVNAPGGNSFQGATEAKEPFSGEHVISRKAIAQGMSDVLRCPVCSCAHFLCTLRMRPRVQRASGIPCVLFSIEGVRISSKTRARCAASIVAHDS